MVYVMLQLGKNYISDVSKRMDKAKPPISQNELARELDMDPSQVSRWFTKNEKRKVVPQMETAEKIENAMRRLEGRRFRNQ